MGQLDSLKRLRTLPARLVLSILGKSKHVRTQLAEMLRSDPEFLGPLVALPNRTLVNCGDHYMWIANGDAGVGSGLLKHGAWQRGDFEIAIVLIREADVPAGGIFLDVGANIGTQSVYAALCGFFGRIIAIEPEPRNVQLLYDNLSLNDLLIAYYVVPKAVGSCKGIGALAINASDTGMHHLSNNPVGGAISVEVDTVPGILADLT